MFVAKMLFVLAAVVLVSGTPQGFGGFGAPRILTESELESSRKVLQNSLTKLAAGEGPNYTISKILSASVQVVAGSLDKYSVELIDSAGEKKVCDVSIWTRSWLPNGTEVTFDCPNEQKVIKNHS
ncbi:sarcocystatin-A [Drosophila grimshawi]|uniref:GH17753 n=1 Tax=Drosophila grimshawi TaxID=7222 RepID=B4JXK5_DROGR|nr:sarcocystatin-A [Drosophila grimshawi]EDV95104.1 GH17753 [Drosophila grimshawi]